MFMQLPDQKDWPILKEMLAEGDRGAALIGAGFVETKLKEAIATCLRPDKETFNQIFKPGGPLGDLSNKALVAYMLGLMKKETKADFQIIAQIRNQFAHKADPISFDTPLIRDWCAKLTLFNRMWETVPPNARPRPLTKPRDQYLETISAAANWLHHQATHPGIFRNQDNLPF